MISDHVYMQRAMELACLGIGRVSPNPRVGCVIVHDEKVIGEGWHRQYGGPHAEVEAVNSVREKDLLPGSTVYVNLEPCSHFGKTPPCADMLVRVHPKKVVIANPDTHPLVAGQGIKKLREAGIEVVTGVMEKEGRWLNQRFFTSIEKNRPYIILKWAQTADGFIARENYESKWISHELARQWVHRWRAEEDAVLVGTKTAAHDNPQLNVRDWSGRNPVRVVLDRFLRLSDRLALFDRQQPTLCYNVLKHEEHPNLTLVRVDEQDFLQHTISDMHGRKIQSIIVEGGRQTLELFLQAGLWDEARVFVSPRTFGKGMAAPLAAGKLEEVTQVGEDQLFFYRHT